MTDETGPDDSDATGDDQGGGSGPEPEPAGSDGSDATGRDLGASSGPEPEPPVADADAAASPEQLLGAARSARQQARRARHAYWFPLVLFGLLTCASVPFYIERFPARSGVYSPRQSGPSFLHSISSFLRSIYLGGFGPVTSGHAAYYWLAAVLVGLAATAMWYRLRGNRTGLRTPSRGFVITGLVLLVLALVIPVLADQPGGGVLAILMPGDLLIRGTFPLVLIGLGLCVLAWAERSVALTVIAAGYLAVSLVASLYDIENVLYRLHWTISPAASSLPNVVLPALVLLLSGASAWVVQRQRRPRSAGSAGSGNVAGQGP
jgi:hypothetical protein